jgi:alkylresorcinol/alkylpyrone synthase
VQPNPRIAAVASALPEHCYPQERITAELAETWREKPALIARLASLHGSVRVETRHLALPIEAYADLQSFGAFNDAWIRAATDLGERAARAALDRAGLAPRDVDAVFFSTVTGVASPSIDARLVNRLGLRSDVKRLPLFGLGCVAGAAAVARAADWCRGEPEGVALVLCVELCSLTSQRGDRSVANLIAAGLFGDGAGAALVVGGRRASHSGPCVEATRSVFYPDTEEVMGWSISEHGFRIVLSPAVPEVARAHVGADVDGFLADQGLARSDVRAWVCHPGGPRVLEAVRDALELDDEALALSWDGLRRVGNLSSASVLLVLEATCTQRPPPAGAPGVMLAMGPGFCSELLLLRW